MDVMDGTEKSGKINPLFLRTTIRGVTRKKKEKQREMNECSGNDCVSGKSSRDKIKKKRKKRKSKMDESREAGSWGSCNILESGILRTDKWGFSE